MTMLERVQQIVEETTGIEHAPITARLADVCEDSLEAANIIIDLEDEFSIDIEGFQEHATLGDIVKFIEAQKAA